MKQKLLLVLSFMLVTLGLQAEEVTLSFASTAQRISQDGNKQVWKNGVITFTNEKASSTNPVANYSNPVRLYQGSSIDITIESGYEMTKIVFVSDGTSKYKTALENSLKGAGYTYTNSGNNYTVELTPAVTNFKIAKLTAQARLKSLTVSYDAVGGEVIPSAPKTPELTASRKFLEEQVVEISCSTEGAKIYYTTDGTDPTAESTEYSEPFTVTETTTVKAIAVNEIGSSEVATATYTKGELMTIAQAKAQSKGTEVFIDLKDVVVTVNHSNGYYIFIQDETTGICIYSSGAKYAAGTQFAAGVICGTTDVYNNMNQIKSAEFIGVETTTTTVEPIEVTVADLADADKYATYEGRYVKLTDVTLAGTTITQGEATYTAYDRFELDFATEYAEATTCDIEGIPACYKTTLQIYPVVITEKEVHVHSASKFTVEGTSIKAACECEESCGSLTLVLPSNLVYNGQAKEVTVEGSIEGIETPAVVYSSDDAPINAGTYTASITVGDVTATVEYTITALDIAGAVVGEFAEMTYSGATQTPVAVVTIEGVGEVTGSWSEVTNVDDKSTFTANGNFTGTLEAEVGMKAKDIAGAVVGEFAEMTYSGAAQTPAAVVTIEGVGEVTGSWSEVTNVDDKSTFTANGNFTGSLEAEVGMKAKDIAGAVVGEFAEMTYSGAAQTPVAKVTIEGVGEVTGSWSEVTNVGDKSTFTANGNFTGSLEAEVGMKAKELEETGVVLETKSVEYTGEAIEPAVTVTSGDATLVEGTDYDVTYSDNVEVGEATVTVTAKGNYSGTIVVKFAIEVPASIAPVQSQTEVVYYDLCGRRVQQPLKGKIYIANGKKVIF